MPAASARLDERRQKMITLESGKLTIQNLQALESVSLFNPDYLHLDYGQERG